MTRKLTGRLVTSAALALALGPLSAFAQTEEASDAAAEAEQMGFSPTFVRAYDVALSRISQDISHDEQVVLNLAAYAAAAGAICPDLSIDEAGIYGLLTESSHDALSDDPEADPQAHHDFSLIAFGVITGLMLEEAARDEAGFCADAIEYSNETGQALLKQTSTAVPLGSGN